jgi:hypothetical protein
MAAAGFSLPVSTPAPSLAQANKGTLFAVAAPLAPGKSDLEPERER